MKTVSEVIRFYSTHPFKRFWSKASKRATRRILFFQLPLNWKRIISSHFKEFAYIQNTRGYILQDFKNSELFESFFERFNERLHAIGEITDREKELMDRALYSESHDVPELANEYAKAAYLEACLWIGMLKPQSALDDIARSGGRWWDDILRKIASRE